MSRLVGGEHHSFGLVRLFKILKINKKAEANSMVAKVVIRAVVSSSLNGRRHRNPIRPTLASQNWIVASFRLYNFFPANSGMM